jgi:hypothetical protein
MASPKKSNGSSPRPSAAVADPLSGASDSIYRNIENGPLIGKIKILEVQLEELLGIESMEVDELDPTGSGKKKLPKTTTEAEKKVVMEKLMNQLLDCFNTLLKTPYGSLGYLVESDAESIVKLYDVDSDEDYYMSLKSSEVNVGSKKLEGMVAAGGGKRLLGVETNNIAVADPEETLANKKVADGIVNEIVAAIKEKIEEAEETD